ncbi:MAG TPA: O-antigen polymerase [Solirubrobacterales bacterium]|nr:O-antigen polymerase [Solirubrobacterales bacterium]
MLFWLVAGRVIAGDGAIVLVALTCLIVATVAVTALAAGRLLPGWRWVVASPLAIAAATWLPLFALRPIELYFYPGEAITPMIQLGYDVGDLSRTIAIAGIGCATWSLGFLFGLEALRRRAAKSIPRLDPLPLRRWAPWIVVVIGAMLAGALFMRQGGPSALIHSAGSLHTNQGSGFYGQLGIWMLEGTALYAFAAILRGDGLNREARRLLFVSAPLAALCTLALGSRGFIAFGLLAAAVIYLRLRSPSARNVAITVAVALLIAAALEFTAIVRTNASSTDLGTAVERTFETPVPAFQTADLSVFDDFVAMQEVVPSSISRLNGNSLLQIPAALAPRALWPGKPQPVDNLVTEYLYPGATAGTPITMQGELYWNFGLLGVALGSLAIGLLMGLSTALLFRREALSLILYAVLYASVFALLTRALGTMTANTFIALVGVGIAVVAIGSTRIPHLREPVRRLRSRIA